MSIWRWPHLSEMPCGCRITLGEGDTPLLRSRHIGPVAGLTNLWFKLETVNPTGSFKDRFAAVAVAEMGRCGKRRCVATSSGNTGAALAAYCAAAGIACEIFVVESAPVEKLKQMAAHGARLCRIRGFGGDEQITGRVFEWIRQQGECPGSAMQISAYVYSPVGMAGVETIGCELMENSDSLDHVFVPAGGGGLTLAVARGCAASGQRRPMPKIHCAQPIGNDTIASPLRSGASQAKPVRCATKISGLQVATVLDGNEVIVKCRASGGTGYVVADGEVWEMQNRLGREEGLFCEPAAAVAVVAATKALQMREVGANDSICCVLTGTGFKDMPSVDRSLGQDWCPMLEFKDLEAR